MEIYIMFVLRIDFPKNRLIELRAVLRCLLYFQDCDILAPGNCMEVFRQKKSPSPQLLLSAKTVISTARSGARTLDTLIKSQVLFQLS